MDIEALTRKIVQEVVREVQGAGQGPVRGRPLITREDIVLAHLQDSPVEIPPGALVTPWAQSLAQDLGVLLLEGEEKGR